MMRSELPAIIIITTTTITRPLTVVCIFKFQTWPLVAEAPATRVSPNSRSSQARPRVPPRWQVLVYGPLGRYYYRACGNSRDCALATCIEHAGSANGWPGIWKRVRVSASTDDDGRPGPIANVCERIIYDAPLASTHTHDMTMRFAWRRLRSTVWGLDAFVPVCCVKLK